jgi:hypothetical protein
MPKNNNNYALIVLSPSYSCNYRQRITTGVINNKKTRNTGILCLPVDTFLRYPAKPAAVSHATPSGFVRVRGSTAERYSTVDRRRDFKMCRPPLPGSFYSRTSAHFRPHANGDIRFASFALRESLTIIGAISMLSFRSAY